MDTPAGNSSGSSPTPNRDNSAEEANNGGIFELPPKLRVHALAKLLGSSSREVIKALDSLGESVRSAQSNITRDVALQVVRTLHPEQIDSSEPDEKAQPVETRSDEKQPAETRSTEPASAGTGASKAEQSAAEPKQESAAAPVSEPEPAVLAPVFAAPQAMFLAPEPAAPRPAPAKTEQPEPEAEAPAKPAEKQAEPESAEEESEEAEQSGRRRRRRGRRGRGRGRGGEGEQADSSDEQEPDGSAGGDKRQGKKDESSNGKKDKSESAEPAEEAAEEQQTPEQEGESESSRRRRRRRRRKGSAEDESGVRDDDPPNTVVHVREASQQEHARQEPSSDDEVRAVKGSTRLEAKRQRRRDGREAGRRRAPVLSEAEFLARRESVDRKMVVRENGDQIQIAVMEDNVLVENFVTSSGTGSLVGNVYLGRVQNVLPSMEAAFVDIGRGRNAVLYAGEVDWDAAGLAGKARRIEQALSTGDSVLVQVTKDPVGHKGARLTTQISLPGRFLVYVPGGGATGISRKLPDNERKRLKEILKRIVPDNAGVIIRTASEGTSEEALDRDVRRLQAQWEVIKEKADVPKAQAPQLLYEEPDLLIKVVRDLFTEDFSAMTVQGDEAWETIEAYVQHVAPELVARLTKHVGKNDVFTEQRISEQISKALDRKVWLPSGGYLVIDRTEAMTVIDVNTGKYTGSGGNLEETVTRNNLEAAEEIVRQLRLRDIGGIIVIDFIDMVLESNRDLVLRRLTECLGRDRTRHQVAEVTSLGLVQMTRKRVGTGLLEAYSSTCEHCRGRGLVVSTDPVTHGHNHSGNGGGQSRKNRNKGKPEAPAEPAAASADSGESKRAEAAEPAKAAPAASAPVKKDKEPEQVAVTPPKPEKPKPEESKPVAAAAPAPAAEPEAAEPAAPVEQPAATEQPAPVEQPAATEQPAPVEQPAATEQPAPAGTNGRSRRRKVSRPAGSTGGAATPVVLASAPSSGTGDHGAANDAQQPQPAATVVRRSRRSASRPAGPPVEGEEGATAGASAEG